MYKVILNSLKFKPSEDLPTLEKSFFVGTRSGLGVLAYFDVSSSCFVNGR